MELHCITYTCHAIPSFGSLCAPGDSVELSLPLWSSSSVEEGLKMDLYKLWIQLLLSIELLETYCPVHGGSGDLWRDVYEGGNWAGWCFCSQTAAERQMISFPTATIRKKLLGMHKGRPLTLRFTPSELKKGENNERLCF